ncbi:uncharacterized protein C8A04DRAFT_27584 [Dichotomopilus funicola]|uniref:Uncharacterized protein n=1 Tax=Dichotomopilus funicola TaxID=1934379 RepID=A0AAN6V4C9_9PEZI|nr:hypothetical protein C8A04DRAFT_27584 [Dichotomopilus funicola]
MQIPHLQSITSRFSPQSIRTSFRRSVSGSSVSSTSSTPSSRDSSTERRIALASSGSTRDESPAATINRIVMRRKTGFESIHSEDGESVMVSEEEDRAERPPHILEPRPEAMFSSMEERMMAF